MGNSYEKITAEFLGLAGVKVDGSNPWDIRIHNKDFYRRALTEGELGLGESYMDGWWEAEKIDELIHRILVARLDEKIRLKFSLLMKLFTDKFINLQSRRIHHW